MPGQGPFYIRTHWTLYTAAGAAPTKTRPDSEYQSPCPVNKKNYNNIGGFPGGGLENQDRARTIAHSLPGVKETLNYMLREKLSRGGSERRRA